MAAHPTVSQYPQVDTFVTIATRSSFPFSCTTWRQPDFIAHSQSAAYAWTRRYNVVVLPTKRTFASGGTRRLVRPLSISRRTCTHSYWQHQSQKGGSSFEERTVNIRGEYREVLMMDLGCARVVWVPGSSSSSLAFRERFPRLLAPTFAPLLD